MKLSSAVLVVFELCGYAAAAHAGRLEQPNLRARQALSPRAQALLGTRSIQKLDPITEMRAEMCSDMKDEHGKDFDSYEECEKFMKKICKPGKDKKMDGDKKEEPTGKGHCSEFFPEKEEPTTTTTTTTFATVTMNPNLNPFDKEKKNATKEEKEPEKKEVAKEVVGEEPVVEAAEPAAPAAALPPSPAAAPAPATTTMTTTAQGSWWIHKMDEERPMASQGFQGEAVEHNDKSTMIDDWRTEFGPRQGGEKNIVKICAEHPGNLWCRKKLAKAVKKAASVNLGAEPTQKESGANAGAKAGAKASVWHGLR